MAASGGQGNDQGWGGSGWGTNWNGTAGEEGWGSGNAWASSQNAQTNWDTLNNANYSGANSTKPLPDSANSVQKKLPQSPAMAHSQSWGGWNMPAHGQEYVGKSNDNIPALVVTSPTTNPAGSVKSAKRRKNTLGSILSRVFTSRKTEASEKASKQKRSTKKTLKKQKAIEPSTAENVNYEENTWYDRDGGDENNEPYENAQYRAEQGQVGTWPNNATTQWRMPDPVIQSSPYPPGVDSGIANRVLHEEESNFSDYDVIDAEGAVIEPAQRAFYSRERLAKYRLYWAFDPDKDSRVSTLLDWIQKTQKDVATFGVCILFPISSGILTTVASFISSINSLRLESGVLYSQMLTTGRRLHRKNLPSTG